MMLVWGGMGKDEAELRVVTAQVDGPAAGDFARLNFAADQHQSVIMPSKLSRSSEVLRSTHRSIGSLRIYLLNIFGIKYFVERRRVLFNLQRTTSGADTGIWHLMTL